MCLHFCKWISYKWNHLVCICSLLRIVSFPQHNALIFIYAVVCITTLFSSLLLRVFHCLDVLRFIYLDTNEQDICFFSQFLEIKNKAVINIFTQVFVSTNILISLGKASKSGIDVFVTCYCQTVFQSCYTSWYSHCSIWEF